MITNKKLVIGLGGALGVVFLLAIPEAWKNLGEIVKRQASANLRLIEWKEAYQALLPVNERWQAAFIGFDSVSDQLTLTRIVNIEQYGLNLDVDRVEQVGSEEVVVNGMPIGLQKLCIATGREALEVSSTSMSGLRAGMRAMALRADIEMGTVEYAINKGDEEQGRKTVYVARVSPFCIRVRTDQQVGAGV